MTRATCGYVLAAAAGLAVALIAAPGCSNLADDCENVLCAADNCVPSTAGGPVAESCGVFVSSDTGSDETGTGAPTAPFKTIGRALADPAARNVYACAGAAYEEEVVVSASVGLYGGLDCATWGYVAGGPRTQIVGPADAVAALQVRGASTVAAVEDIDVTASDAVTAGRSSIAMLVDGGQVNVTRASLVAGGGADGESTPHAEAQAEPGEDGQSGAFGCDNDSSSIGGPGGKLICNGIDVNGGDGGAGILSAAGGNGQQGEPTDADGGLPGDGESGGPCSPGGNGTSGLPGDDGIGATGLGTLGPEGVVGVTGQPGVDGTPGQGGGGGGGANACSGAGPGGGGGGSGGCGGLGGPGGGAGGSSIALVSINATMSLLEVALRSATGGVGGDGQLGQLGGEGGDEGGPGGPDGACDGGDGGAGGPGGAGGGGLGGHSIGIAYIGPPPLELGGVTTATGEPGGGGLSGTGSADAPDAGASGQASERQQF